MNEIRETGIRGFLKWFQQVQPALYQKIAPQLSQHVPNAFSDYHQGGWRVAGMNPSDAVRRLGYLSDTLPAMTIMGASSGPITYTGGVDITSNLGIDPGPVPTVDVATAANSGDTSSSTTDLIGSIVKGVSALYLTKQQANIQQQVVNTQLQRAALGLPPLPSSLSQLGIPQVNVGLSSGTSTLVIGGGIAALLALVFLGKKRSRR